MGRDKHAISIRQPWTELILQGRKKIEVRGWDTSFRGPLWLHAGGSEAPALDQQFGVNAPARGAYVGRVVLSDISPIDAERWERWRDRHLDFGRYRPGLFAWFLTCPQRLSAPVVAPGRPRVFEVEDGIVQMLYDALVEHSQEGGATS